MVVIGYIPTKSGHLFDKLVFYTYTYVLLYML